ncbi:MAG TPA: GFA family protein [Rhizobiaceae bacterium]|nr:GFA family protein [Rhizobiaceae bacterium]
MAETHSGSCLCGAVRFTTTGPLRGVIYCHCSQCRKQTGHVVAATQSATRDLMIEGDENLSWYAASPDAKRGFCKTCGSLLFWRPEGGDRTSIMAGSFERPSGLAGLRHIFVAEKGDYYEINDDLPQLATS